MEELLSKRLKEWALINHYSIENGDIAEYIKQLEEMELFFVRLDNMKPLVKGILNLVKDVGESKKPMITSFGITTDEGNYPFISFWASVGRNSPFQRISKLRELNEKLFDVLSQLKDKIDFASSQNAVHAIETEDIDIINTVLASYLSIT